MESSQASLCLLNKGWMPSSILGPCCQPLSVLNNLFQDFIPSHFLQPPSLSSLSLEGSCLHHHYHIPGNPTQIQPIPWSPLLLHGWMFLLIHVCMMFSQVSSRCSSGFGVQSCFRHFTDLRSWDYNFAEPVFLKLVNGVNKSYSSCFMRGGQKEYVTLYAATQMFELVKLFYKIASLKN